MMGHSLLVWILVASGYIIYFLLLRLIYIKTKRHNLTKNTSDSEAE